jgi:hypothetical protein
MARENVAVKHDNVSFHFLGSGEDECLNGTVLCRDGEMVLEILGGDGPYSIVGRARGHHFEGCSSIRGMTQSVHARWAEVGGRYVGIWVEEEFEYLFSFEL